MLFRLVTRLFRFCARMALRKYKPFIIGVTGSVGKTTTKDMIYAVLAEHFDVRRSHGNFNNEIGVPLAILGLRGGHTPWSWVEQLLHALVQVLLPVSFPKVLILEMGADHPGDIAHLVQLAHPTVGVVTSVGMSHIEFFGDTHAIQKEKSDMVRHLPPHGVAVLNADDALVAAMARMTKAKVITYGYTAKADVRAIVDEQWVITHEQARAQTARPFSATFQITYQGDVVAVRVAGVPSVAMVSAILAAFAVGISQGLSLAQMATSVAEAPLPKGRMHLIPGVRNSLLIDDTYNAAPNSTLAAIAVLPHIETAGRFVAVLGDMLELGVLSEEGHRSVGRVLVDAAIDVLVVVGERARWIGEEAEKNTRGMQVVYCTDSTEAAAYMREHVLDNDVILVKGSQGARMERVVKALLEHPERAGELLVRQRKEWLAKP